MRPPALMRGPTRKPRCQGCGAVPRPAASKSAASPGRCRDAHHGEPLPHESAVQADERHDVGYRGEGHEVDPGEQVRLWLSVEKAASPQHPAQGDEGEEDDTRRAQETVAGQVVVPVRIDHATASGNTSGDWWWSMTTGSRPSRRASASGSWLAVPQSTVTSSRAPRAARELTASTLGP